MRVQRRLLGFVLAAALAGAVAAVPAQAARLGTRGVTEATAPVDRGVSQSGWLASAWSWLSAMMAADSGYIVP
jgi:hypothetical protein